MYAPLPPGPATTNCTFSLYEFDCSKYLIQLELNNICPLVSALFHLAYSLWIHPWCNRCQNLISPFLSLNNVPLYYTTFCLFLKFAIWNVYLQFLWVPVYSHLYQYLWPDILVFANFVSINRFCNFTFCVLSNLKIFPSGTCSHIGFDHFFTGFPTFFFLVYRSSFLVLLTPLV